VAHLTALLACHAGFIAAPLVSGPFGMGSSSTLAGDFSLFVVIHACEASSQRHH